MTKNTHFRRNPQRIDLSIQLVKIQRCEFIITVSITVRQRNRRNW